MSINLPHPIAAYFAADRAAPASVADCFTENAIVKDEGRTHSGREAIRQWKMQASTQYSYVSEPFALEKDGERSIVTSRVTGNFPGSPVDLRYAFRFESDKISHLEIML
jgi:hypothetical protein